MKGWLVKGTIASVLQEFLNEDVVERYEEEDMRPHPSSRISVKRP